MRLRLARIVLGLSLLMPTALVLGAQPAFAADCNTPTAAIDDQGGGDYYFSGNVVCNGGSVTKIEIKVHSQRCSWELLGCKAWTDIFTAATNYRYSPGSVNASQWGFNLACGVLYHTWVEAWAWAGSTQIYYNWVWSSQTEC